MLLSTEGIVIKSLNVGESSKLLTLLTRDRGVIYVFVNNCKIIKTSSMVASSELFAYSQFVLFKNKDKYVVNDAHILKLFSNMRKSVEGLAMGCYIAQVINEIATSEEVSEDYLRLVLNSLHVLDEGKQKLLLVKAVFELKMAQLAGFMPNLVCCKGCACGQSDKFIFLMSGEIICHKCSTDLDFRSGPTITGGVIAAMRHIIYSDMSKIFSFKLSDEEIESLSKVTQQYLLHHLDTNLSTLEYLLSVLNLK